MKRNRNETKLNLQIDSFVAFAKIIDIAILECRWSEVMRRDESEYLTFIKNIYQ